MHFQTLEANVFPQTEVENQEKDDKIELAEMWRQKGVSFYRTKEYHKAIVCFQKALELNPDDIEFIVNLVKAYQDSDKFENVLHLLNVVIDRFTTKEDKLFLKILFLNNYLHMTDFFNTNDTRLKNTDFNNLLLDYNAPKKRQPYKKHNTLNFGGILGYDITQSQKAVDALEKMLNFCQANNDLPGKASTLKQLGIIYNLSWAIFFKNHKMSLIFAVLLPFFSHD